MSKKVLKVSTVKNERIVKDRPITRARNLAKIKGENSSITQVGPLRSDPTTSHLM